MTESSASKIGETQDAEYRAFLSRGEVHLQKCSDCGYFRPPTSWVCSECLSEAWTWERVSGRGVVETFVWYMRPLDQRFRKVPYNVALVRLEEGARVMGNVNGVAFGALAVGQAVQPDISTGFQDRVTLNFKLA